MPDLSGSPHRRLRLAAELRRLRNLANLTGDVVADRLGWAPSKVSRIENSRSGVKDKDLQRLLDIYGVEGQQRAQLMALVSEARRRDWMSSLTEAVPSDQRDYFSMEAEAETELSWQPYTVQGLLQIQDYARPLFRTPRAESAVPPAIIEQRLEARVARQRLLIQDDPLRLIAIMDESVLLRRFGGDRVMRDQLMHIIELSELPNVTVRIVPLDNQHVGGSGPFVILHFTGELSLEQGDITYIELMSASDIYNDDPWICHQYRTAFGELVSASLDDKGSRDLIHQTVRDRWA